MIQLVKLFQWLFKWQEWLNPIDISKGLKPSPQTRTLTLTANPLTQTLTPNLHPNYKP